MKSKQSKPYQTNLEIIANAIVNSSPETLSLEQLAPELKSLFDDAMAAGYSPVSVRWPEGQFAIVFCEAGQDMPDPNIVIAAYLGCTKTNKTFPDVEVAWAKT